MRAKLPCLLLHLYPDWGFHGSHLSKYPHPKAYPVFSSVLSYMEPYFKKYSFAKTGLSWWINKKVDQSHICLDWPSVSLFPLVTSEGACCWFVERLQFFTSSAFASLSDLEATAILYAVCEWNYVQLKMQSSILHSNKTLISEEAQTGEYYLIKSFL